MSELAYSFISLWERLAFCHRAPPSSRDADSTRVFSFSLFFFFSLLWLSLRPQRECSITTHAPARVPPVGCHEAGACARARMWAVVLGGGRTGKGRGLHAAPHVTWSRTSEQIDEAKAIKGEEGFASLERWLPWICEWIMKTNTWMREQWMDTLERFLMFLNHIYWG